MAEENLTPGQRASRSGDHVARDAANLARAEQIKANRDSRPNVQRGTQGREALQRNNNVPR